MEVWIPTLGVVFVSFLDLFFIDKNFLVYVHKMHLNKIICLHIYFYKNGHMHYQ